MRAKDLAALIALLDPESPVVLKQGLLDSRSYPVMGGARLNLQQWEDPSLAETSLVLFFDLSASIPDDPAARRIGR